MTTQEYLAAVRKIHGGRYDYSKVVYKNKRSKVEIVCREHGVFWQVAYAHKRGDNCPQCALRERTSTTEKFVKKAQRVHGERYDYSKVVYLNASFDKVVIVCREDGEFTVTPNNHLHGFNCPKCGVEAIG